MKAIDAENRLKLQFENLARNVGELKEWIKGIDGINLNAEIIPETAKMLLKVHNRSSYFP